MTDEIKRLRAALIITEAQHRQAIEAHYATKQVMDIAAMAVDTARDNLTKAVEAELKELERHLLQD